LYLPLVLDLQWSVGPALVCYSGYLVLSMCYPPFLEILKMDRKGNLKYRYYQMSCGKIYLLFF
jgi:hypothetical protein